MHWLLAVVTVMVIIAGCHSAVDEKLANPPATEVIEDEEGNIVEYREVTSTTTTTLSPNVETLPIATGRFEDHHWFKWILAAPIPDPIEQYSKSYRLWISSAEDDLFSVAYTLEGGDEFGSSFCLQDKPNCPEDGLVYFEWVIPDARNEILFRIPEGTFSNATGLTVRATIQTGATDDPADLVTEDLAGGAQMPVSLDEIDPC